MILEVEHGKCLQMKSFKEQNEKVIWNAAKRIVWKIFIYENIICNKDLYDKSSFKMFPSIFCMNKYFICER